MAGRRVGLAGDVVGERIAGGCSLNVRPDSAGVYRAYGLVPELEPLWRAVSKGETGGTKTRSS